MIEIHTWLFVTMIVAIAVLGMMLWNNLREREFHVRVPDLDCFEQALPSIAGMTKAIILDGNRAKIIQNGGFSTAFLESVAAAKETIHFETYVWWTPDVGLEMNGFFRCGDRFEE